MTQPALDYDVDPQPSGSGMRLELNTIVESLLTKNSGATEPPVTFPGQDWIDTSLTPPRWKVRNQADDAFLDFVIIDPTNGLQLLNEGAAIPGLATAQSFTAVQTVDITGSNGELKIGSDQDSGIVARLPLFGHNSSAADTTGSNLICRITDSTAGAEDFDFEIQVIQAGVGVTRATFGAQTDVVGILDADVLSQSGSTLATIIADEKGSADDGGLFTADPVITTQIEAGKTLRFTGGSNINVTIGSQLRAGSWVIIVNDSNGTANLTFVSAAGPNDVDFRGSGLNLTGIVGESPQCVLHWFDSGDKVNIRGDNT